MDARNEPFGRAMTEAEVQIALRKRHAGGDGPSIVRSRPIRQKQLPIDLPVCEGDHDALRPAITTGDLIFAAVGILSALAGGTLVWWGFA